MAPAIIIDVEDEQLVVRWTQAEAEPQQPAAVAA